MGKSVAQLANDYIKGLQAVGSGRKLTKKQVLGINLEGYKSTDYGPPGEIEQHSDYGIGSRILDVVTRPVNAVAAFDRAVTRNVNVALGHTDKETLNPFGEAFGQLSRGIEDEAITYKDAIKEGIPEPVQDVLSKRYLFGGDDENHIGGNLLEVYSGSAGLVGDVVADPINLIGAPVGKLGTAIRGATKSGKAAKAAEESANAPVTEVVGESYPQQYFKEIVDADDLAKYKIAEGPAPEPVPTPVDNARVIADAVQEQAATPPTKLVGNAPRKAGEQVILDNATMGQWAQSFTSKAAAKINAAERTKVKPPTWLKEVNPDEYAASMRYALDNTRLSATDLARDFAISYKTALRHMNLLQKDGIIESSRDAAKRLGLKNARDYGHNVLRSDEPQDLLINRIPATDETRAAAMFDDVVPATRAKFDELAAQGHKPEVIASDGRKYTLSTADIFEALPRKIVEDYNFGGLGNKGAGNLYPSQWHAGAAEALRMSELGVDPVQSTQAIAAAMKKALRGNAQRSATIQVESVAQALADNVPALASKLTENIKNWSAKDLADAEAIAKTKVDDIQDAFQKGTTADAVEAIANVGNDVSKLAREAGASDDAAVSAVQQVGPMVAKIADETDIAAARAVKASETVRTREGWTPQADKKIFQRQGRIYVLVEHNAEQLAREAGLPTLFIGDKPEFVMNSFLDKLMNPVRNAFVSGYHTGGLGTELRVATGKAEHAQSVFRHNLNDIAKTHGENVITAWNAFRRHEIPPVGTPAHLAYADLMPILDKTVLNGLRGRLFRNGASLEQINSALKEVGFSHTFKKEGTSVSVPEQIQSWDIKDPLPALEQINKAALLIETRMTVGVSASRFGSSVPKPGYVKLQAKELSKIGPYVDTGLFYPKEAGQFIQQLDELARASTSFRGQKGGIAWFANNIIDPIMQIWKPFMTILRPGHLIRNLWSDIMIASFNGVMSIRPYRIAAKTLKAAGQFTKQADGSLIRDGMQGLEKLEDGIINGADTAFLYKGKPVSFQGLYKMAHDEGLLQSWHMTEDIQEKASKLSDRLLATKWMKTMGKANEIQGQFGRIAHFQYLLEKKGMSIADAGIQVRRHHPDVKGLTPFEQKYLRRIFPFYSWFRQAMPVVMSTMLSKPGRITGLFKAEYAAAEVMGVDPDSFVDPFPDDKLYPSFIRDNITGPIFGDYSLNLGMPQEALLGDTLNGSPARNIAGMVNPIFKLPYEVAARERLDTGAGISDMSDFIDSQIPIVNQVANISGHSVVGLGAEQRAVEIGDKSRVFNTQLVNFLTGLGLMDTRKDSYQNIALKEKGLQ